MGAIHGLKIRLGIPANGESEIEGMTAIGVYKPVAIVLDNNISCGQIDTKTAGAGGEEEYENFITRLIVFVDGVNAIIMCGAPVNPTIFCFETRLRVVSETFDIKNLLNCHKRQ
jgi:hypothetical protein